MNVASLELCKELYELSGWDNPETLGAIKSSETTGEVSTLPPGKNFYYGDRIPAYDLGYLLRKMPKYTSVVQLPSQWVADYDNKITNRSEQADNPEDAICLLAITLFKQGILKKETT